MAGTIAHPVEVVGIAPHALKDAAQHFQVVALAVGPDKVGLPRYALGENGPHGRRVILGVNPVAHVQTVAVQLRPRAREDVGDLPRNELFYVLARPVVVRAVGNGGVHPVGAVPRAHEHVRRSLGGAVGARRPVWRLLGEARRVVQGQVPVHLVGGDVVEQFALPLAVPVFPCRLEQRERAQDVRTREGERIPDRAVDMAFGREVDDPVDVILTEQRPQHIQVADVPLLEYVVRGILDVPQVGKIPGIGQLVEVDDPVIGVFVHEKADYVRADKARAARDQDSTFRFHYLCFNLSIIDRIHRVNYRIIAKFSIVIFLHDFKF